MLNSQALEYNDAVADRLDEILTPLRESFNITTLAYIKFLKSGNMIHISNHRKWIRYYLEKELFNDAKRYTHELQKIQSGKNKYFLRLPSIKKPLKIKCMSLVYVMV